MTAAAELLAAVRLAIDRRAGLRARLQAAGTDCLRLFHGIAEGEPGLAIDRFGPLLLLQTFRAPLPGPAVQALGCAVQAQLGEGLQLVCNHRGPAPGPDFAWHQPAAPALQQHECRERGVRFCIQARHRGQDPWLFLDLRAGRARVHALAGGKRVLNLFAYTCGAGVVAAAAGAQLVWNVDFAASALAIGARNAERNGIAGERFVLLHADCIAVLRQLAGTPVQRRARARPLPAIARQQFDLVFLDPPRWAKGPFGAIDVVRDYAALFKPALLTLADGGTVIATNHVPEVPAAAWIEQLRRCAHKAGRPLRDVELLGADEDFPALDSTPPLKIAVCRL